MATVLIVEDNPRNLRLATDILEYAGFSTLKAEDAESGLQVARDDRPDLILMDIQLPDRDGVSVLADLRADPSTERIPVVAVTAFAMSGDRERFLAAGFDDYLAKPVDLDLLVETAERLCAHGGVVT